MTAVFDADLDVRSAEPLARYTTARMGGKADWFAVADNVDALQRLAQAAWAQQLPLLILGAGSNMLIGDGGFRGLVVVNRARHTHFALTAAGNWAVHSESGTGLPALARLCEQHGAGGMAWAATVPGTVGGAVFGNAGAYDSDTAQYLQLVTFLHRKQGLQTQPASALAFGYRTSWFKSHPDVVLLSALWELPPAPPAQIAAQVAGFQARRRASQPPGATLGSMFKNPPGDYAGRLIEAAGLKGYRIGQMQISPVHANFFVNLGDATAQEMLTLVAVAQARVWQKFGVRLELEIVCVGE